MDEIRLPPLLHDTHNLPPTQYAFFCPETEQKKAYCVGGKL
jgi:hypothetical protein